MGTAEPTAVEADAEPVVTPVPAADVAAGAQTLIARQVAAFLLD